MPSGSNSLLDRPVSGQFDRSQAWLRTLVRQAQTFDVRLVVGNATAMSATAIVTSILGIVFWWLAARSFSPASVGLAAAALSACSLLGNLSVLGTGTLLISELGRSPRQQAELLSTCLAVTGVFAAVAGGLFGILGPAFMDDLQPLHAGTWTFVLFAVFVSSTTVGQVLDQFVVGILQSGLQFWRNTLYSAVKLVLLLGATLVLVNDQALTIFTTWPLGNLVSLGALAAIVALRTGRLPLAPPRWTLLRGLGRSALSHHALNLAVQAPSQLLPVLVTVMLSATTNAYFFPAWMICSVAFVPQTALTITLFAVGARQPQALVHRARLTLGLSFLGGLAAIAVTWLVGDRILGIFGDNYVTEASRSLHLLVLAVVPIVIKTHYIALLRIQRRVGMASLVLAAGALIELIAAVVGALTAGLLGLTVGWLVGLSIEAALMTPTVWRLIIAPRRTPPAQTA